jgi:predicted transcriptional regulator
MQSAKLSKADFDKLTKLSEKQGGTLYVYEKEDGKQEISRKSTKRALDQVQQALNDASSSFLFF